MITDRPTTNIECLVSYDKEPCRVSTGAPVFLRVVSICSDQTPIKPLRRTSETKNISKNDKLPFPAEAENCIDDESVFSDITDHSAFDSLNNNTSFRNTESLCQHDSMETSLRVEIQQGPLHEEKDSHERSKREESPSSSKRRAAFATTDFNDTPPQLARRSYSSLDDWTLDSPLLAGKCEENLPGDGSPKTSFLEFAP